jgi:hypothetical protein
MGEKEISNLNKAVMKFATATTEKILEKIGNGKNSAHKQNNDDSEFILIRKTDGTEVLRLSTKMDYRSDKFDDWIRWEKCQLAKDGLIFFSIITGIGISVGGILTERAISSDDAPIIVAAAGISVPATIAGIVLLARQIGNVRKYCSPPPPPPPDKVREKSPEPKLRLVKEQQTDQDEGPTFWEVAGIVTLFGFLALAAPKPIPVL